MLLKTDYCTLALQLNVNLRLNFWVLLYRKNGSSTAEVSRKRERCAAAFTALRRNMLKHRSLDMSTVSSLYISLVRSHSVSVHSHYPGTADIQRLEALQNN